nr:ComEC/Rec2 family competence protein [uncultured Roseibium sp.]
MLSRAGDEGSEASIPSVLEDQALLWISFSFAAGIAVYTMLPAEPSWQVLSGVLSVLTGLAVLENRKKGLAPLVLLALAFLTGGTVASIRTAYVAAPRLAHEMTVTLNGIVVDRIERANGLRLVVGVETVNERSVRDVLFPKRIRVRVPRETAAVTGDTVKMRARLFPPAGPVMPGGYDFSFGAYYSQIGATGFSFGAPAVLDRDAAPLAMRLPAFMQSLRDILAARITADLRNAPEAALAVALLVGDRSAISERDQEDLRAAGLAHVLAISGLHMALFAGGTYAAASFLLSLFPAVSLRLPTHKIAAGCALLAAIFYLLVSGGSIATQRSFLMIALVFVGVLTGRRGLTVRSVALAGLFLLALAPERLFHPGFQMSFAAVICLVAVYEAWREYAAWTRFGNPAQGSLKARLLMSAGKWMLGLFVTALVAGTATGIIAAHHFGRVAPYGLVGNMLGMPVFSLLIMPMGVLAFVLMPFGLAALPLSIMAFGLKVLLKIAAFVAALDGGSGVIARVTATEMLAFSAALFAFLLMRGRMRAYALLPLLLGLCLVRFSPSPDVHIAANGYRIAARDNDGVLKWSGRNETFLIETWYQSEGVAGQAIKSQKMRSPQIRCDTLGCVVEAHAPSGDGRKLLGPVKPLKIALPRMPEALHHDCRYADLIVSDLVVPGTCPEAIVFGRSLRQSRGAISLWLSPQLQEGHPGRSAANAEAGSERADVTTGILRIEFAIAEKPRPWHRRGNVTRASLRHAR